MIDLMQLLLSKIIGNPNQLVYHLHALILEMALSTSKMPITSLLKDRRKHKIIPLRGPNSTVNISQKMPKVQTIAKICIDSDLLKSNKM